MAVQLEWEPFLLNPRLSEEGEPIIEHLVKKYGPSATRSFDDPNSPLKRMGRAAGIQFNNDRNIYPTVKAHALIEYLKETGNNDAANAMMEDLYKKYFEEAVNINSDDVLIEAAEKHGVPKEKAQEVLLDQLRKDDVLRKDESYKRQGISGVPFFMIEQNSGGRPVGFSGAQPIDVIAECLEEASEE